MEPLRSLSTFMAGLPALDQYSRTMSCPEVDLDAKIRVPRFNICLRDTHVYMRSGWSNTCNIYYAYTAFAAQASQNSIAELQRQLAMEVDSAPAAEDAPPSFRAILLYVLHAISCGLIEFFWRCPGNCCISWFSGGRKSRSWLGLGVCPASRRHCKMVLNPSLVS